MKFNNSNIATTEHYLNVKNFNFELWLSSPIFKEKIDHNIKTNDLVILYNDYLEKLKNTKIDLKNDYFSDFLFSLFFTYRNIQYHKDDLRKDCNGFFLNNLDIKSPENIKQLSLIVINPLLKNNPEVLI